MSQLHAKKRINQGSAISQTFTIYESLGSLGVWMLRVHVNLRLLVSLYKQWGLVTSKTAILPPHCR